MRLEEGFAWKLVIGWTILWAVFIFFDQNEEQLKLNEWGDMFAGFSTPIALLFVLVGVGQNEEALQQNRKALSQNESALEQNQALLTMQLQESKEIVSSQREMQKHSEEIARIERMKIGETTDVEFDLTLKRKAINETLGSCDWHYRLEINYSGPKIFNVEFLFEFSEESVSSELLNKKFSKLKGGAEQTWVFEVDGGRRQAPLPLNLSIEYSDGIEGGIRAFTFFPEDVKDEENWFSHRMTELL